MTTSEPGPLRARVPEAAVTRLGSYLQVLETLRSQGTTVVSSRELAAAAGVNSAKLRRDLSYFGSQGVRGVGYGVDRLTRTMREGLGLGTRRSLIIVGAGHLGAALATYPGFGTNGFRVAALFDTDPSLVGTNEICRDLVVRPVSSLADYCAEHDVAIAVLAVPATDAQHVADVLVAAGVRSLLNFSPVCLDIPPHVDMRRIDIAAEIHVLSYRAVHGDGGPVSAEMAHSTHTPPHALESTGGAR